MTHPLDMSNEELSAGNADAAERILLALQEQSPDDPRVQFNLGWHMCRRGEWSAAAVNLDVGRYMKVYGSDALKCGKPIWDGGPLEDKTVHLRCEGGFGDEIINIRFVRHLVGLGAKVIVSCGPSLMSLFERIPGVRAVVRFEGADYVHCDYWIPAMSSMRWFPVESKPYITPCPQRVSVAKKIINARGLKVGIRWSGNPKFEHEQHRRFPVELMFDLCAAFPSVNFYSFQYLTDLVSPLPEGVVDLQDTIADFDDTAAALAHMDLVITSCTCIAHLAGAMGKPTWVIPPVAPYYVWAMPGDKSPWYDSVRLFRQERFGEWEAPFTKLQSALTLFVEGTP